MDKDSIIEAAARFAQQMPQEPMQPNVVQPQPVPMSIQLLQRQATDGAKYVVLIINHLTGQSVYHFDPDGAESIGDALKDAARVSRTGLEIPKFI